MRSRFWRPRLCLWSRNGESLSRGISSEPVGSEPGISPTAPQSHSSVPLLLALEGDRIVVDRLLPLPVLALGEMGRAERGVAARIRGAAEPDLVPRPRMRVERLSHIAHDD